MPDLPECTIACGCGGSSVLMAKAISRCGQGFICGVNDPDAETPNIYYNVVTSTWECELWDCTHTEVSTQNIGGSFIGADCNADPSPSCNPSSSGSGCEDIYEPGPWPGTCTGTFSRSYSEGEDIATLPGIAIAAAIPDEDASFSVEALETLVGSTSSFVIGIATSPKWKFKRVGPKRIPMYIRLTIAQVLDAYPHTASTYNVTITIAASEDGEVEWALEILFGYTRGITAAEFAQGRKPAGW